MSKDTLNNKEEELKRLKEEREELIKNAPDDIREENTEVGRNEAEQEIANFFNDFGLEDLITKEFKRLDENQKLKVVRDLKRRIVDIVKYDAQTQYSEDLKTKPFVKKIISSIAKERSLKNIENKVFEEFKNSEDGKKLIADDLMRLTDMVRNKEIYQSGNNVYFCFVKAYDLENSTEDQKYSFRMFNIAAERFTQIPYEWGQEKSGKHKKEYEQAKAEYEQVKTEVLNIKAGRETNENKGQAILEILEIDNAIKMEQLLNTHPEFEKTLNDFEKSASGLELAKTSKNFLKSLTLERAGLMVSGAGARTLARGAAIFTGMTGITILAAPVIGGAVGYYRGKIRGKETLEERQKNARRGKKDESVEATNTVTAENLNERIELLMEALEKASTKEEFSKKLDQIKRRIQYTQEKIENGLVNFGDAKTSLNNQYNLVNNLNRASVISAMSEETTNKETDERLKRFLSFKNEKISKTQKEFITAQAKKGMLYGAGFALAGYGVRYLGEQLGWWGGHGIGNVTQKEIPHTNEAPHNIVKNIETTNTANVIAEEKIKGMTQSGIEAQKAFDVGNQSAEKEFAGIKTTGAPVETTEAETLVKPDDMAVIHEGEGIEHAFRRQIENNPKLAESLGFSVEDGTKEQLHKFSGEEAHRLAIKFGYVSTDGQHQVGVMGAEKVAFELKTDSDGEIYLTEKTVDGKILETLDGKEEYEFGKNTENQYEKEFATPHHEETTDNVLIEESTTTPTSETEPTQTNSPLKGETSEPESEEVSEVTTEAASKKNTGPTAEETLKDLLKSNDEAHPKIEDTQSSPSGFSRNKYIILETKPEFAKNPYHLSEENLLKSYNFFKQTLEHYFTHGGKIEDWQNASKLSVKKFITNKSISIKYGPINEYLEKLIYTSRLEPKEGLFTKNETIKSYISRALQQLTANGKLEEFEENLRK